MYEFHIFFNKFINACIPSSHDLYKVSNRSNVLQVIRYPPKERRYGFVKTNYEPIVLSSEHRQLVPSAAKLLQIRKAPSRAFDRRSYQPILTTGNNARHKFAEGMHIRWKHVGDTEEPFTAALYMPTGWPLLICIGFILAMIFIPILGSFLVHSGFFVATYYKLLFWGPLKTLLRTILIRYQLSNKRWEQYIAPPHFLEPRVSWKFPFFLRHDTLEDVPPELAYKPPINRIDYTMYILTQEDYDEMDLGMDEMEYVDDLLQFRDTNPHLVARLLKYKLGDEKFYYYFDEDILSDESDEDDPNYAPRKSVGSEDEAVGKAELEKFKHYLSVLDYDEPWMHDEFDKTFTGPDYQLEEIRKRRLVIDNLKQEIRYLHALITRDSMFAKNYKTVAERKKAQKKAIKLMDRYARYSKMTKERIKEIEPSGDVQAEHNVALSKYLPLIDQMSHYNHRLNLKHEKQRDPKKRRLQLDIFGGP